MNQFVLASIGGFIWMLLKWPVYLVVGFVIFVCLILQLLRLKKTNDIKGAKEVLNGDDIVLSFKPLDPLKVHLGRWRITRPDGTVKVTKWMKLYKKKKPYDGQRYIVEADQVGEWAAEAQEKCPLDVFRLLWSDKFTFKVK